MTYFITVDKQNNIIDLYNDEIFSPETNVNPIQISDVDGELLSKGNIHKYKFINGVLVDSIAHAINIKIEELIFNYNKAISTPISYTSLGNITKTYQTDKISIDNIIRTMSGYSQLNSVPNDFYWVSIDNTKVPFTYEDIKGLAAAMMNQGWSAFQNLQNKKDAAKNASDVSSIQSIIW